MVGLLPSCGHDRYRSCGSANGLRGVAKILRERLERMPELAKSCPQPGAVISAYAGDGGIAALVGMRTGCTHSDAYAGRERIP